MFSPAHLVVYALLGSAGYMYVQSSGGLPLSLATDVGVTDVDACTAVAEYGPMVVPRLEESGFPHATTEPVERYRLTRGGEVEAAIEIRWIEQNAYCVPLDADLPYTISFDMNPGAYSSLVHELTSVLSTGKPSSDAWKNRISILTGTDVVDAQGESKFGYKAELAAWAAGLRARGGA